MARLNEAAAPLDAAEILRRKYSRQNKEIARINSTQCIRIRNLENEVSRLLAENLELREQIIRQQAEADSNNAQEVLSHVGKIKADLEAKLSQLGALITTLGNAPPPRRKRSPEGKEASSSPARSPNQRNWKNRCSLSEAVGGPDGRLPAIMEDKTYPRRTLNSSEIVATLSEPAADTTDSPDIGPPPVSQFVNEDPVKIDLPSKVTNIEDVPSIDPANSINLEHRKKRKDNTGTLEHMRPSRFEPRPSTNVVELTQSLKSGAKRKLSARDDEEGQKIAPNTEVSPDDFKFTRRTGENKNPSQVSGLSENPARKVQREIAIARGATRDKSGSGLSSVGRKALGQKSTNTNVINSPKKNKKSGLLGETSTAKQDASKKDTSRDSQRDKKELRLVINQESEPHAASIDVQPEPETPAAPDIFSPLSAGSSEVRVESRDTPPPPDLGPGTEGQRPSRRARGAVSYAEPNLRDKMRRPTKELVDAVTGEGKGVRTSFVKLETELPSTAKIKQEPEDDDAWKSRLPSPQSSIYRNSPLVDKVTSRESASEILATERRYRGSSTLHGSDGELPRSSSASSISALLAERRRIKQETRDTVEQISKPLEEAMAKLDIYEFSGSSPREANEKATAGKEDKYVSRMSRRASSAMIDLTSDNASHPSDRTSIQKSTSLISSRRRQSVIAGDISEPEQTERPTSSMSSRRRQSTLGLGQPTPQTDLGREKPSDVALKRSTSSAGLVDPSEGSSRSDRVSARRRSMML